MLYGIPAGALQIRGPRYPLVICYLLEMGGSFHGELLVITRWYTQALTNQLQGMSSLCFAVSLYALLLNNVEYQSVEAAPSQASQGELRLAAWLELSSAPPLAPELSSRPIDT